MISSNDKRDEDAVPMTGERRWINDAAELLRQWLHAAPLQADGALHRLKDETDSMLSGVPAGDFAASHARELYVHPILEAQRGTPGYEAEKAALTTPSTTPRSETPRTAAIARRWSLKGGGTNTCDASPEAKELYEHAELLERELERWRFHCIENENRALVAENAPSATLPKPLVDEVLSIVNYEGWQGILFRKLQAALRAADGSAHSDG